MHSTLLPVADLGEITPGITVPCIPELVPTPSQATLSYSPIAVPPHKHVPYCILHDPSLADSMMERLRTYLPTAPGALMPPSPHLQGCISMLELDILSIPSGSLGIEETTTQLWERLFRTIQFSVREIDRN
jgi:hypothetical protein